ncbi:hypothetical protein ABZP36_024758 [Zizania latifolia]
MAVHSSSSSQQDCSGGASISNQSAGYNITNQFNHPKQYLALLMLVLWFHTHTQPQLSWSRTLIGIGVFLGLGASAAVVLKKLFVPRVKSWTQRSHAKGDENGGNELKSKLYEDIKEAIQASESAFSDIAKTNQGLLASKDEGPTNNSWRDFQQTHGNKNNTPPHSDFDPGKELHQTRKTPLPQCVFLLLPCNFFVLVRFRVIFNRETPVDAFNRRTYIWSISEIMAP